MMIAKVANDAAKAKLGDNAEVNTLKKEALNLLSANFDSYKKKAGL